MSKNPIMTFPIKKTISTELFIDRKHVLFINKGQINGIDPTSGREVKKLAQMPKI